MANPLPLIVKIKRWEGGLSCDQNDRATLDPTDASVKCHTNQGIRYSTFVDWARRYSQPSSEQAFLRMSAETWQRVFLDFFWLPMRADVIAQSHQTVAEQLVDFAWGSGPGIAARTLQTVLNARFGKYLSVDGKIGPQTISAINSVPAEALNDALYQARVSFLKSIVTRFPNQEVFLKGWLRRAADIAGK